MENDASSNRSLPGPVAGKNRLVVPAGLPPSSPVSQLDALLHERNFLRSPSSSIRVPVDVGVPKFGGSLSSFSSFGGFSGAGNKYSVGSSSVKILSRNFDVPFAKKDSNSVSESIGRKTSALLKARLEGSVSAPISGRSFRYGGNLSTTPPSSPTVSGSGTGNCSSPKRGGSIRVPKKPWGDKPQASCVASSVKSSSSILSTSFPPHGLNKSAFAFEGRLHWAEEGKVSPGSNYLEEWYFCLGQDGCYAVTPLLR